MVECHIFSLGAAQTPVALSAYEPHEFLVPNFYTPLLKSCYPLGKSSTKKNERGDSGLYSEDTIVSTNDCVYSSSCHVENKHFENVEETNTKTVESYEDFIANLPLPVTEFNKTVRKVFRCLLNC